MDRSRQQCVFKFASGRMFAEVIITGHSTDSVIAPVPWTACSLLQLSSFSSLLLSHCSPTCPRSGVLPACSVSWQIRREDHIQQGHGPVACERSAVSPCSCRCPFIVGAEARKLEFQRAKVLASFKQSTLFCRHSIDTNCNGRRRKRSRMHSKKELH